MSNIVVKTGNIAWERRGGTLLAAPNRCFDVGCLGAFTLAYTKNIIDAKDVLVWFAVDSRSRQKKSSKIMTGFKCADC